MLSIGANCMIKSRYQDHSNMLLYRIGRSCFFVSNHWTFPSALHVVKALSIWPIWSFSWLTSFFTVSTTSVKFSILLWFARVSYQCCGNLVVITSFLLFLFKRVRKRCKNTPRKDIIFKNCFYLVLYCYYYYFSCIFIEELQILKNYVKWKRNKRPWTKRIVAYAWRINRNLSFIH